MQNNGLVIHTDGGSRGNPGKAASAFVVTKDGKVIFSQSKYLGTQTNNFAEYSAVVLALNWLTSQKLITNNYSLITFVLDSELVVRQINGIYKVKDPGLKILHTEIINLLKLISVEVVFKNVRREENVEADFLVNKELDANS